MNRFRRAVGREGAPAAAYLAWAIVCVVWGTTYYANQVGVRLLPPFTFAGTRFLSAGLVMGVIWWLLRRPPRPLALVRASLTAPVSLAGLAILGGGVGFPVWAQQWMPSGATSLIAAITPLWMVLLEAVRPGGDRLRGLVLLGIAFSLSGVGLVASEQVLVPAAGTTVPVWAVGAILLGGLCWASGSVFTRHYAGRGDVLLTAASQMLWAGTGLLTAGFLVGERLPAHLPLPGVAALAYQVVFGSLLAYGAYLYALNRLPLAFVSTHIYINPIIALWVGAFLGGERVTGLIVGATGLILVGLMLVRRGSGIGRSAGTSGGASAGVSVSPARRRRRFGLPFPRITMHTDKINLAEKFGRISDYWNPRRVGELNGQEVRLAKLKGAFIWHRHEKEDELFYVVEGRLRIELRDRTVELGPGELFIVPRGVEHRPVADEEVHVLLFEPKSTLNTGNVRNERTVEDLESL